MRSLVGVALGLLCFVFASVSSWAGENAPPPRAKVGEAVKICDNKPDGSVSGWIRACGSGGMQVCIEKITGEKRNPGDSFEMAVRMKKVDGRDRPEDADAAALRMLTAGDKVEVDWFRDGERLRIAGYKLVQAMPRQGVISGKVTAKEKSWFALQVSAAPKEREELAKQTVSFNVIRVRNPNDAHGPSIESPEQLKVIEDLSQGDIVEINYRVDGRFRFESIKKTGRDEGAKQPEPEKKHGHEKKPKSEPKSGDPEPE